MTSPANYSQVILDDNPSIYWPCQDAGRLKSDTDIYRKISSYVELGVQDSISAVRTTGVDTFHLVPTPYGYNALDTRTGYVRKETGISVQPTEYTMEVWSYYDRKPPGWAENDTNISPLSLGTNGDTFGIIGDFNSGNYYSHHNKYSGSASGTDTGVSVIDTLRQWVHWVQTWDGSHVRVYKDGELILTYESTDAVDEYGEQLCLGYVYNSGADNTWPGFVMHAAFYVSALSEADIINHYETMTQRRFTLAKRFGQPTEVVLDENFANLYSEDDQPEIVIEHMEVGSDNLNSPRRGDHRVHNISWTRPITNKNSGFTLVDNVFCTSSGTSKGWGTEPQGGAVHRWWHARGGLNHTIKSAHPTIGSNFYESEQEIWMSTWDFKGPSGSANEWVVRYDKPIQFLGGSTSPKEMTIYIPEIENPDDCVVVINSYSGYDDISVNAGRKRWIGEVDANKVVRITNNISSASSLIFMNVLVIEFIGDNWTVQKIDHTFSSKNAEESEPIPNPISARENTMIFSALTFGSSTAASQDRGHNCYLKPDVLNTLYFRKHDWDSTPAPTCRAYIVENPELNVTHYHSIGLGGDHIDIEAYSPSPQKLNVEIDEVSDVRTTALLADADDQDTKNTYREAGNVSYRLVDESNVELWRNSTFAAENNFLTYWTLQVVDFSNMTYTPSLSEIANEDWSAGGDFAVFNAATPSTSKLISSDDLGYGWLQYDKVVARDGDLQLTVSVDDLVGCSDLYICFRSNGLTQISDRAQGPINGYFIRKPNYTFTGATPNNGAYILCRSFYGTAIELASFMHDDDLTTEQNIRVQYVHDQINVKVWNADEHEPETWNLRYKDPDPILTPGYIQLTVATDSEVSFTGSIPNGYSQRFYTIGEPEFLEANGGPLPSRFEQDTASNRLKLNFERDISATDSARFWMLDEPLDLTNPCLEFDFKITDGNLGVFGAYAKILLAQSNEGMSENPDDEVNVLQVAFWWDTDKRQERGIVASFHTGTPGTFFETGTVLPITFGVPYRASLWFDSVDECGYFTLDNIRDGKREMTSSMSGLSLSGVYDRIVFVTHDYGNQAPLSMHQYGWLSDVKVFDKLESTPVYAEPVSSWNISNLRFKVNPYEQRGGVT